MDLKTNMLRALGLIAIVFFSGSVEATPIPVGSTWQQFVWEDLGVISNILDCTLEDTGCSFPQGPNSEFIALPPWTLPDTFGGGILQVTDAEYSGEQYIVVELLAAINDLVDLIIGETSVPAQPDQEVFCGFDPDTCFITNGISSGSFVLSPGPHALFIIVSSGLNGGGTGFFRVVPEPDSLLLILAGAYALWRSRSRVTARAAI